MSKRKTTRTKEEHKLEIFVQLSDTALIGCKGCWGKSDEHYPKGYHGFVWTAEIYCQCEFYCSARDDRVQRYDTDINALETTIKEKVRYWHRKGTGLGCSIIKVEREDSREGMNYKYETRKVAI
jgi:hypothetical protein